MQEETKTSIIAVAVTITIFVGLFGGFLWYVGYMFEKTKQDMHNDLRDNLVLNNSYEIINIDSAFVSGNECHFFVSIEIKNNTNEIVLNDFNYDTCNDCLYYGWYHGNNLDEKYGRIVNEFKK